MGGLNRIDRRKGTNIVPAGSGVGNEILSILEDGKGILFAGTFHKGLQGNQSEHRRGKSVSPRIARVLHQPNHAIDL